MTTMFTLKPHIALVDDISHQVVVIVVNGDGGGCVVNGLRRGAR